MKMVYAVPGPGRRPMETVWSPAVSPSPTRQQLPGAGQAVQQVSEVIGQVTWRELGTVPASLGEANPCPELPGIPVCTHAPGKDEMELQILNPQENYTGTWPQGGGPWGGQPRERVRRARTWLRPQRAGDPDSTVGFRSQNREQGKATWEGRESRVPGYKPPNANEGWCCRGGCQGPVLGSPALANQGINFGWDQ